MDAVTKVPHYRTVVAFCVAAIAGYAVFSVWAIFWSGDPALRGDTGGTWKSFAVAAFTFWLGSSSGGKAKDERPPEVIPPPELPHPTFGKEEP